MYIHVRPACTWEFGNTTIQITRKRNGTHDIIGEIATEYVAGTFFLLISLCLMIFIIYVCVLIFEKWRRKGSLTDALESVRTECNTLTALNRMSDA